MGLSALLASRLERHFRFEVSAKMGKFAMHNSIEMKETLRFLQDLSLNNNKQWFDANRDRYLAAKATVDALAVELIDGIRSFDKSIGAKYGKSAAQVALRWLTQRGIVAIPKSSHKERMEQNLNVLDFTLTAEEMAAIAGLNEHDSGLVNFGNPQFVKYLIENYG